jgi:hypothetical protein
MAVVERGAWHEMQYMSTLLDNSLLAEDVFKPPAKMTMLPADAPASR